MRKRNFINCFFYYFAIITLPLLMVFLFFLFFVIQEKKQEIQSNAKRSAPMWRWSWTSTAEPVVS